MESAIHAGELGPQLPGYRELESILGVSRSAIRPALAALVKRGVLVQPGPRRRFQVAQGIQAGSKQKAGRKILMLEASQLGERLMISTVIASSLASRGLAENWTIDHMVVKADQNRASVKRWQRLLEASGADVIVVVAGGRKILGWASGCGVPALALGGDSEGLDIPTVGYDSEAMVTIALDRLFASGHRDVCMPLGVKSATFIEEMEHAMVDGFARYGVPFHPKLHFPQWHSHLPEAWQEGLRWRFGVRRPDALVLIDAGAYQSSIGVLMQLGLKVPDDISLVVIGQKSEFTWCYPLPACFDFDPLKLADKIGDWIESPEREQASLTLLPKWVEGGSIRERKG